ncbi:MAG: oligoendopeptidase F [Bacteroidales bacterium]|nr:oligoendopeptidase F [Bacteroidales bacterium]
MKSLFRVLQAFIATALMLTVNNLTLCSQVQERNSVDTKYTWNLADIYASDEAWEKDLERLKSDADVLAGYKGKLGSSSSVLLEFLQTSSDFSKLYGRLYSYASMKSDQDLRNTTYLAMDQEMRQLGPVISAKISFAEPEILELGKEKADQFLSEQPEMGIYKMYLNELFRQQEHLLSEKEEIIMAHASSILSGPYSVYSVFANTELPYPNITLSTGETVTLNQAGYSLHRASANRNDRELVFNAFWSAMKGFQATLAEQLLAGVNSNIFVARARHYDSALESALDPYNIPLSVYHSLIDNVNENLTVFHRYLSLRKRMLEVDTLKYSDTYAPVVKDIDLQYAYDEAQDIIINSLAPLGTEYQGVIRKAFNERWLDVYPTAGKRSGAYSQGSVYDVHPYMLLNYNNRYDDVSTVIHELGHTMQSYLSNTTQPYPLADYPIFTAEVASTFNEELLGTYMVNHITDDETRLSILMSRLDNYKGTLFRQTKFAEFELAVHELAEAGEPVTSDVMNKIYGDLLKKYYGHDEGVCYINDLYAVEWSYIPHFYYNFYVYQYSTSFTASAALAEDVLSGKEGSLEKYLSFLSAGGSDYPIDLLKIAGVDMTTSEPFHKAIVAMNRIMDEIEAILDKMGK